MDTPEPPKVKYYKMPPDVLQAIYNALAELPGRQSFDPMLLCRNLEPVMDVIVRDPLPPGKD